MTLIEYDDDDDVDSTNNNYIVCAFVLDIHDNDWKTVNNNKEIIIE